MMLPTLKRPGPTILRLALFVAITVAVWLGLDRMGSKLDWLQVETKRTAAVGELLPIRVRVGELTEPTQLCVDLHWSTDRHSSREFLASGGSRPIGRQGGNFDFNVMVRPVEGLRYVHGIIYLSPTGSWDDHTFVAATAFIPVTHLGLGDASLIRLSVRQQEESHKPLNTGSSPVLRWIAGVLLIIASFLVWTISHSSSRWWLVLAAALASAGAWELLGLEAWLGELARAWARTEDVYYAREWLQRLSISAIFAAAIVTLIATWRNQWLYRTLLLCFGIYLAVSSINLLSLHAFDRYARQVWHGVLIADALRLVSAAAVLASALSVWSRMRSKRVTTAE